MRKVAIAIALASLLIYVPGAFATGGSQTFRVLGNADVYLLALSASCPDPSYAHYMDPNDPTFDPTWVDCWLTKDNLGYDGETGAITVIPDHLNHAFACAVSSSATGIVGNALPFPANMAISDSIVVAFDLNDDGAADTRYGGRVDRHPIGAVLNRITGAVANGDVGTLADTPNWWLSAFALHGATPSVAGNVDNEQLILFNQGGFDVTVDCTF